MTTPEPAPRRRTWRRIPVLAAVLAAALGLFLAVDAAGARTCHRRNRRCRIPVTTAPATAPAPPTSGPTPPPTSGPGTPTSPSAPAPAGGNGYDPGTPTLTDLWVDPVHGSDADGIDGRTPATAVRSISRAWNMLIPASTLTGTGYRIRLQPGTYDGGWFEARHGSRSAPIVFEPAEAPSSVTWTGGPQWFDCSFVYLRNLRFAQPHGGDVIHFASCDHVWLSHVTATGLKSDAHDETVKVNQSSDVWIEDSELSGAGDNNVDFVAVARGGVLRSRLHAAGGWCAYAKGGSFDIVYDRNEAYDCAAGITAGEGAGAEFMQAPFLHYHAYAVRITNNLIHDVYGAGAGVAGGFNVLIAHNTMWRVGARSHVIEIVHGALGCDGDTATCAAYQAAGGWTTTAPESEWLPNRHVYVTANVIWNPSGAASQWQQFWIANPATPPAGLGVPSVSRADDDLRISGNVIWNGGAHLPLGIEGSDACTDTNPTCNAAQLTRENSIDVWEPAFAIAAAGDMRPAAGTNLDTLRVPRAVGFDWSDAPTRPDVRAVPPTTLTNDPGTDFSGTARPGGPVRPGAY